VKAAIDPHEIVSCMLEALARRHHEGHGDEDMHIARAGDPIYAAAVLSRG
jgi:hypothetical protein